MLSIVGYITDYFSYQAQAINKPGIFFPEHDCCVSFAIAVALPVIVK